jgi:four helix bundle protein
MEKAKSFRDLIVWQKAHRLVLDVYKRSKLFPKEEMYGLTSQIRRSSVSVAANIAEGFRKRGPADKVRFLNISQGSLSETEYYLMLAKDLEYTDTNELLYQADEVGRILESYLSAIKK